MRLRRIADFVLVMSIVAAGIKLANACSRVLWVRSGQPVLVGRSMDWFEPMHTNLWALPRGIKRSGLAGKNSLRWTSKYGSLVAVVYNFASADGINEKGLDANILWLAESDFGSRNENLPGLSLSQSRMQLCGAPCTSLKTKTNKITHISQFLCALVLQSGVY